MTKHERHIKAVEEVRNSIGEPYAEALQHLLAVARRCGDEKKISECSYDNYCGSDYKMCADNSAKAISKYLLNTEEK